MGKSNGWDVVIRQVELRGSWWWNAWHDATFTELSGTAATRDAAQQAVDAAMAAAPTLRLDPHRPRRAS